MYGLICSPIISPKQVRSVLVVEIRRLTAREGRQYLTALAEGLLDCVEGGASVSFMASLSKADAESFFEKVVEGVQRDDRILLAAFIDSKLVGTVQILTATPPNQPHRADVAKLLVLRSRSEEHTSELQSPQN